MAYASGDRVPLSPTGAVAPLGKAMMVVALPLPKSPTRASYYHRRSGAEVSLVRRRDDAGAGVGQHAGRGHAGRGPLALLSDGPTLSRLAAVS